MVDGYYSAVVKVLRAIAFATWPMRKGLMKSGRMLRA